MLGHLALVEDDMLFGSMPQARKAAVTSRMLRRTRRILPHGDGVEIDHAIDAIMRLLQRDELDDRAEIIAEVQIAGRLHAGKDAFREICHVFWGPKGQLFILRGAGDSAPRGLTKGGFARIRPAAAHEAVALALVALRRGFTAQPRMEIVGYGLLEGEIDRQGQRDSEGDFDAG